MNINKKQKITIIIGLLIIAAALLTWISFGAEIFTKTQVLVEKQDEIMGTTIKEWKDQFVLGLDYTAGIIGITFFSTLVIVWKLKNKR